MNTKFEIVVFSARRELKADHPVVDLKKVGITYFVTAHDAMQQRCVVPLAAKVDPMVLQRILNRR